MTVYAIVESIVSPCLMALEILSAQFIFGFLLKKREHFWLRTAGSWFFCLEVVVFIQIFYYKATGSMFSYDTVSSINESVYKFLYYIAIFGITILCGCFCYKNSLWIILFYSSGAYATQHIAKSLASFFKYIPIFTQQYWFYCLLELFICAILYVFIYLFFVRDKEITEKTNKVKLKVLLSLFVVFICIGISRFATDDASRGNSAFIAETLYAIVSCALVLFILFSLTENDKIKSEVEIMTELLHREKEQYKLSKENIEIINIKCHDLKHQIRALSKDMSPKDIQELENSIKIYDSMIKTGNDVLDVILTEKSLFCENNKIELVCTVDGKELSFMENMDIYSLFGNAISNAIERVEKIQNEAKKYIGVTLKRINGFTLIHFENFYEDEVDFKDGLPITHKDKNYHGFGMKSMQYIAKKYNGNMTVTAKDGLFKLDFLFPIK